MPVPHLALVWAQTADGTIGRDGTLPWAVPEDLAHFRRLTAGHPVVMGRRTWASLPPRFRPLPGRTNVVLTRAAALEGAVVAPDLDTALALAAAAPGGEEVWVVGGGGVFTAVLPHADRVERTDLDLVVAGDTHAPALDAAWEQVAADPADGWHTSTSGVRYRFTTWLRGGPATGRAAPRVGTAR